MEGLGPIARGVRVAFKENVNYRESRKAEDQTSQGMSSLREDTSVFEWKAKDRGARDR